MWNSKGEADGLKIPEKHTIFPALLPDGEEAAKPLLQLPFGRVESIVSTAAGSPAGFWYDQAESEWVSVLEGWAVLAFPEGRLTLKKGECILIPAHLRHRVEETSASPPCRWLCIFYRE